ncbi:transferrin-binding protein-like solute binding protein [Pasteurellaceae bacterium TAE3-ERU1]|nr:transferrin-binding protein-like solute binding protein [Pasteurellaceae bacterium TAE3-ERU1]
MKRTYLALALVASLGLAACSSSDDDKSTEDRIKDEWSRIEDQVKNEYNRFEDQAKDGIESVKNKVHSIKIGDKEYDLTASKGSDDFKDFKEKQDESTTIISSKDDVYKNSSFGVVKFADHGAFFSYGEATKNMPTSETVNYTGAALFSKNGEKELQAGRSNIKANFGDKTIEGKITSDSNNPITSFKTKIDNNSFNGDGVKGQFYGDGAAEVGGKFHKGGYTGVFGATK